MPSLSERVRKSWNAFFNNKDPSFDLFELGSATTYKPGHTIISYRNERSIIASIYNRIALDVAAIDIVHARLDENKRFKEEIKSGLDQCLNLSANIDQTGRDFIQDVVITMFDEGAAAVVAVDTSVDPKKTDSYDILSMRVGSVVQWYPENVCVRLYNEKKGQREDIILPKRLVSIINNPFYSVMNEPNSMLKRLIRKYVLLDMVDEQSSSGKLDLIVQLPYVIRSEARKAQAEQRRKEIELQLTNTKYGIAYTDGTEKVIQLNRPIDNQLLAQIESLTKQVYSQIGLTEEILNGSANEQTMLNYYNRTVEPCVSAICDGFTRTFLSKTARTQGQAVISFRDPFRLVPINNIADIADKFTRNEILSSNEVRGIIGMKPSDDPKADELRNKNLNRPEGEYYEDEYEPEGYDEIPPEEESYGEE